MSSAGASRLRYAMKTLNAQWETAKEGWSDQVRRDFEQRQIAPLEIQTETTIRAMDQLGEILARMKRECGDAASLD
ncbi:hypothetical protein EP7_002315 [Isosphaeraceae bacterium EP7]